MPTPWYLADDYADDAQHVAQVERATRRAAALDAAGVEALAQTLLTAGLVGDDHWTLVVLGDRATPTLLSLLNDERVTRADADGFGTAFRRLWDTLPATARAACAGRLGALIDAPDEAVRHAVALVLPTAGEATLPTVRRLLRGADDALREAVLVGLRTARADGVIGDAAYRSLFDDALAGLERLPGLTELPDLLLSIDRARAVAALDRPAFLGRTSPPAASILRALNAADVALSAARAIALLDSIGPRPRAADRALFGQALKQLARTGDPSAPPRIEAALAVRVKGGLAEPGQVDVSVNDDAAEALLILHGLGDAYEIAIDAWGGPEADRAGVPEAVIDYAVAAVMRNEVANGGMYQYLSNSYGAEIARAAAALDRLGATQLAKVARGVIALFGPGGVPADRDERSSALDALDGDRLSRLEACWERDPDRLNVRLAEHVVAHREDFTAARRRGA